LSASSEGVDFLSAGRLNLGLCVELGMPAVGVDHALQVVAGELVGDVLAHDQPGVALRVGEAGVELCPASPMSRAKLKDGQGSSGRVEVALPRFCTAELRGRAASTTRPKEGP